MRITDIRADTLTLGPTLVRVVTDEGLVGLSEVGWHDPELFRRYLDLTIRPLLVGQDPLQPARHWERLVFGTHERPYPTPIELAGVVDIALWDLVGKAAGLPLYAVLGGAVRTSIPLYWSCGAGGNRPVDAMVAALEMGLRQGFEAFKVRMDWGPLRIDADPAKDAAVARAARSLVGADGWLGFDANRGHSVGHAIRHGRLLEELGVAHFEEPLPAHDRHGLRQVVDALDVPVSSGEAEQGRWRFRDLIELGNPDIVQPDIVDAGGITETLRIAQLAELHGKPVMPHSPAAGLLAVASLHVYATLPGGTAPHEYSVEYGPPPEQVGELFEEPILPRDGRLELPDRPGLGLALNEVALERLLA